MFLSKATHPITGVFDIVEDNVMPNLVSQKMRLYDIICFFEEYRYAVPTLDSAIGRAQSPFARAQNPS